MITAATLSFSFLPSKFAALARARESAPPETATRMVVPGVRSLISCRTALRVAATCGVRRALKTMVPIR